MNTENNDRVIKLSKGERRLAYDLLARIKRGGPRGVEFSARVALGTVPVYGDQTLWEPHVWSTDHTNSNSLTSNGVVDVLFDVPTADADADESEELSKFEKRVARSLYRTMKETAADRASRDQVTGVLVYVMGVRPARIRSLEVTFRLFRTDTPMLGHAASVFLEGEPLHSARHE